MKKAFRNTKVGKILTSPVVKSALGLIPFGVGSTVTELLTKTDTPEGVMSREKAVHNALKLLIYAALAWAFLSGKISLEQASDAKDIIGQ